MRTGRPARARGCRTAAVLALMAVLAVLGGCGKPLVWISDPFYASLLFYDREGEETNLLRDLKDVATEHGMRLQVEVLSQEESFPSQVTSVVEEREASLLIFSPLLGREAVSISTETSVPVAVIAEEAPEFTGGDHWSVTVAYEPAYRQAGRRAAEYVAARPPGREARLGVLARSDTERRRELLDAFLEGAREVLPERDLEVQRLESSTTREAVRSRVPSLRREPIAAVGVFAGAESGFAIEQIGGGLPVVVRGAARFEAHSDRLLYSIGYDLRVALERLLEELRRSGMLEHGQGARTQSETDSGKAPADRSAGTAADGNAGGAADETGRDLTIQAEVVP